MCDFVSWIQNGKEIYFLDDDKLKSSDGYELLKYLDGNVKDVCGHGAIKHYFELELGEDNFPDGSHLEQSYPTPGKLPKEITNAILQGKMTRIGYSDHMLNSKGKELFWDLRGCLDNVHEINFYTLKLKIERSLKGKKNLKKRNEVLDEYFLSENKIKDVVNQSELSIFWNVFRNKNNRSKAWKNARIRK